MRVNRLNWGAEFAVL